MRITQALYDQWEQRAKDLGIRYETIVVDEDISSSEATGVQQRFRCNVAGEDGDGSIHTVELTGDASWVPRFLDIVIVLVVDTWNQQAEDIVEVHNFVRAIGERAADRVAQLADLELAL